MAQLVKNLPAMWETQVRSLGWEDPLEKGTANPLQYSWASLVVQLVKDLPAIQETWVLSLGSNLPWVGIWPTHGQFTPRGSQRLRHNRETFTSLTMHALEIPTMPLWGCQGLFNLDSDPDKRQFLGQQPPLSAHKTQLSGVPAPISFSPTTKNADEASICLSFTM